MTQKPRQIYETIFDLAYNLGYAKLTTGDSRQDAQLATDWAEEFETVNKDTEWGEDKEYMEEIECFFDRKSKESTFGGSDEHTCRHYISYKLPRPQKETMSERLNLAVGTIFRISNRWHKNKRYQVVMVYPTGFEYACEELDLPRNVQSDTSFFSDGGLMELRDKYQEMRILSVPDSGGDARIIGLRESK